MSEAGLDKRILDVIGQFNEKRRSGASLFYIESSLADMDPDEVTKAIEDLTKDGKVEIRNYLYYTKED